MCILCARPRKKSFQITTSLTSREMYSLLVFAIQSGESVKAPGMMLILKGMGINTCKIDSSSAIILFFFTAFIPIPDYLVLHICYCLLNIHPLHSLIHTQKSALGEQVLYLFCSSEHLTVRSSTINSG